MNYQLRRLGLALLLVIPAHLAQAQSKTGTTMAQFLNIEPNARHRAENLPILPVHGPDPETLSEVRSQRPIGPGQLHHLLGESYPMAQEETETDNQ
jgi:hypothetical protein